MLVEQTLHLIDRSMWGGFESSQANSTSGWVEDTECGVVSSDERDGPFEN